jgi:adhesin/invasin
LIYCTGLGAVSPQPKDGVAAAGSSSTAATPSVTIGGATAQISYSGVAPGFVGLYQINAVVPSGLASGNQPVLINISGAASNAPLLPIQ